MADDTPAQTASSGDPRIAARQILMRICASATQAELADAIAAFDPLPEVQVVRPPETGLVMMRGRMGGDGGPFNLGEATVTRAVVRLSTGSVGFSYLLGRSSERARLAAIVDALGQEPESRAILEKKLVAPVSERLATERNAQREETAATRVNFFTLVRGED